MWTPLMIFSRPSTALNWTPLATAGLVLLLVGSHVASAKGFTDEECKENAKKHGDKLVFKFRKVDGNCIYDQAADSQEICTKNTMLATFEKDIADWNNILPYVNPSNSAVWKEYHRTLGAFKSQDTSQAGVRWIKEKELKCIGQPDWNWNKNERCTVKLEDFPQVKVPFYDKNEGTKDAGHVVLATFHKEWYYIIDQPTNEHGDWKSYARLCQELPQNIPKPTTPAPPTTMTTASAPEETTEDNGPGEVTEGEPEEPGPDPEEVDGGNSPFVSSLNFLLPIGARLLF